MKEKALNQVEIFPRTDRDDSSMTIWLRRARLEKGDYKKICKETFYFYGNEWENNSLMNNR